MDKATQESSGSLHTPRGRATALNALTNSLTDLRNTSSSGNIMAKRAAFERQHKVALDKQQNTSDNVKTAVTQFAKANRARDKSPIRGESEAIKLNRAEIVPIPYSQVEELACSNERRASVESIVQAFNKTRRESKEEKMTFENLPEQNVTTVSAKKVSNIDRPTGVPVRIIPDYVAVISKGTNQEQNQTKLNSLELSEKDSAAVKKNRERAAVRNKRMQALQGSTQRSNENKQPPVRQHYLPSYIQPMPAPSESAQDGTAVYQRLHVREASKVLMSDHIKKLEKHNFKKVPARSRYKRLSSSSSDSEPSYALKSKQAGSQENEKQAARHSRRLRHRNRNPQRSNHVLETRQSAQLKRGSADSNSQDLFYQGENTTTGKDQAYFNLEDSSSKTYTGVDSKTGQIDSSPQEYQDKCSTLPSNFKHNEVLGFVSSNKDYLDSELSEFQETNTSESNYNKTVQINQLMITPEQTLARSEDLVKKSNILQSDCSNQCNRSSSNESKELISSSIDRCSIASGHKEEVDKTLLLSPQNKSKATVSLETCSNSVYVSNTGFDHSRRKDESQESDNLSQNTNQENQSNVESEVHRRPVLKARKLSEDYWPKDEVTEKLLNNTFNESSKIEMNSKEFLTSGNKTSVPEKQTASYASEILLHFDSRILSSSPKETNLNDPTDSPNHETRKIGSLKKSDSSATNHQWQGRNFQLLGGSPYTSTETLKGFIRNGESLEFAARKRRSRSLDGELDIFTPISEIPPSPNWQFDDPDSKLELFENLMKSNPSYDASLPYNLPEEIEHQGSNTGLNDRSLYCGNEETSILLTSSGLPLNFFNENTSLDDDLQDENDCNICDTKANQNLSNGCNLIPPTCSSIRRHSIVSQSTPLPKSPNATNRDFSFEPADIDEGFTEENVISKPISLNLEPITQQTYIKQGLGSTKDHGDHTRTSNSRNRRRKYNTMTGRNGSNSSNSSESPRFLSDPMPARNKSVNSVEEEIRSIDSNYQYPLNHEERFPEKVVTTSASDLSIYSESTSIQGDPSFIQKAASDSFSLDDNFSKYDSKVSSKVLKKKSFSDPNADAVLTAGLLSARGTDRDLMSVYSSSSEPALLEKMNNSEKNSGHNRYTKASRSIDNSSQIWSNDSRSSGITSMTQSIESMSHSPYSTISPNLDRKVLSIKSGKRAEVARVSAKHDALFKPIKPEETELYTHGEYKFDPPEPVVLDQEEKQFQEVYDSLLENNSEAMKSSIKYRRSCSELPDVDPPVSITVQKASKRSRRPGIVQAPSLNEVLLKEPEVQTNLISSKPISNSTDRILSATLPRTGPNRGEEYEKYLQGLEKLDMRKHVVNNLMETEASYVNSLRILVETYFKPLKRPENHGICEARLVDEIFFQIPQILQQHEKFYSNVRDCFHQWKPNVTKLGELFMQSKHEYEEFVRAMVVFDCRWSRLGELISSRE